MNPNLPDQKIFLRRAIGPATFALLFGAASVFAQSGGAGSSNYGAGQRPSDASGATSGTRVNETGRQVKPNPEPAISADAKATYDINAGTATNSLERLSWGDRRFLHKTSDAGMSEVQIAQLAVQKASDPAVKAFAQKLVDEHTKLNSELASLALQKGLTLDKDDGRDRSYNRLNRQSGADFDQEFVEHMVEQHEDSIKRFEKASTNAKDASVRSFASMHVSSLRQHLLEAQGLQSTVAATDSSRSRSRPGTLATPSGSYDTTPAGPAPGTSGTSSTTRPVDGSTPR